MNKELEEAIRTLKRLLQYCIREQLSNYKEAIEIVLQELDNYKEGNIVSLKLLEKFYLVNKNKNKQMTLANKELFDNFIPKEVIEKKKNQMLEEYKKLIETNSTKAFIMKCQIEFAEELLKGGENK